MKILLQRIKYFRFIIYNSKLLLPSNYSIFHNKVPGQFSLEKSISFQNQCFYRQNMNISSVIKVIETLLPKHLAEKWDNTGLLVEPETQNPISTIFFTNDLTEEVLAEAMKSKANLIVSYHPPIFSPLKAFSSRNWKDRVIMKCIANDIAVYSPHTACDAVKGGVNDWLIKCFDLQNVEPIKKIDSTPSYILECIVGEGIFLNDILGKEYDYTVLFTSSYEEKSLVKLLVDSKSYAGVSQKLTGSPGIITLTTHECKYPTTPVSDGMGRIGKLVKPMKLSDCIQAVKDHCKLKHLRVVVGASSTLNTEINAVACCAGSGAGILKGVEADLYVTGEMSHHDLLDAQHKNINVILCEHSNSERGYLADLVDQLRPDLQTVNLVVSSLDKDPVSIL